jgi:hypothetical protein
MSPGAAGAAQSNDDDDDRRVTAVHNRGGLSGIPSSFGRDCDDDDN